MNKAIRDSVHSRPYTFVGEVDFIDSEDEVARCTLTDESDRVFHADFTPKELEAAGIEEGDLFNWILESDDSERFEKIEPKPFTPQERAAEEARLRLVFPANSVV